MSKDDNNEKRLVSQAGHRLIIAAGITGFLLLISSFGSSWLFHSSANEFRDVVGPQLKRTDIAADVSLSTGSSQPKPAPSWSELFGATPLALAHHRAEPVSDNSADAVVNINFDDLPAFGPRWPEITTSTYVNTQYPPAIFSGYCPYFYCAPVAWDYYGIPGSTINYLGSSSPNVLGGWRDLVVINFTTPISNFKFSMVGVLDNRQQIGGVNVYQNGSFTTTKYLDGHGTPRIPIVVTSASSYTNVTKIEIFQNLFTTGFFLDDVSFTVPPSPTPTPTPTPTPAPSPPANLKATPDEEAIILSWTPSPDAQWYVITRSRSTPPNGNAAAEFSPAAPIDPLFHCVTTPCRYEDPTVNGEPLDSASLYTYGIAGANNHGTGQPAFVSEKPNEKPGCEWRQKRKDPPLGGSITPVSPHLGWHMSYSFSPKDGLTLYGVELNGRKMAAQMSVPYFWLTTLNGSNRVRTRGELRPDGSSNGDGTLYSRLIDYKIEQLADKLLLQADYGIDKIPGAPKACLKISQQYEFFKVGFDVPADNKAPCEPSATINSCQKFRPLIAYQFNGGGDVRLESLNIPERLHFQVRTSSPNTIAVTRDIDDKSLWGVGNYLGASLFDTKKSQIPLTTEYWWSAIKGGRDTGALDNFHQTDRVGFKLPSLGWTTGRTIWPGCPECVHMHWRWSRLVRDKRFRPGQPLIEVPPGNQDLDVAVALYKTGYEEHPNDYADTIGQFEGIRYGDDRRFAVFWYSPTGHADNDTFFWNPAWFNDHEPPAEASVIRPPSGGTQATLLPSDGPVSVRYGEVYVSGTTTFEPFDLSTIGPPPPGYVALNNAGYFIDTDGLVSGPNTIEFKVQSVVDPDAFSKLRIFHIEPDPFDPEKPVWIDRTILPPDTPAPDFNNKTLSARADDLGVFVIAKLVTNVPPNTNAADLRVSCADSSDPIVAGNNLTYTITLTNNGPQPATNVALLNSLSPDVNLVSLTPSQGTCKQIEGIIYCNLNTLAVGAAATVVITAEPTEGIGSFPSEGKSIANNALVRAAEIDSDPSNNSAIEMTRVLPNPNHAPVVTIATPTTGEAFQMPADISINAVATDSDGAISKVEFFDNGELLGVGTPAPGNSFTIVKPNAVNAIHVIHALATDNGGRRTRSEPAIVTVNGPIAVTVTNPANGVVVSPGSSLTLTANASNASGAVSKVEFFANDFTAENFLGLGVLSGTSQYSFVWNGIGAGTYSIVAVATDSSGVFSLSAPVELTVDAPPTVAISSPVENAVFPSATNISISATAQASFGPITKVDFYANGGLIGSATDVATSTFNISWRQVPDGLYSLTAVAWDRFGVSTTSSPINVAVNVPPAAQGEFVWFDDTPPPGAALESSGGDGWYWVDANPAAISGSKTHQTVAAAGLHQHSFTGATQKLPINEGDKLVTYLFLDQDHMPREVMLQWNDGNSWEHRAYWGANRLNLGLNGTASRYYMGVLPVARRWVRLEIPASQVGLVGKTISGMAFTLDGGRATWDRSGKAIEETDFESVEEGDGNPPGGLSSMEPVDPPDPPVQETVGDFIWFDTVLPPGAHEDLSFDDVWNRVSENPCQQCGPLVHRSNLGEEARLHRHSFSGASTPMVVDPGDILFTHVNINPNARPDEIILQWNDGDGGIHRAYWGNNFLANLPIYNIGGSGTESLRYMGGLPAAGGWVRLEIPASYVGLEGKKVSGMSFGFYRDHGSSQVTWACAGKVKIPTTVPTSLHASLNLYQFFSSSLGYFYSTNDIGRSDQGEAHLFAYVFPNAAAGTVPIYRLRSSANKYLFTTAPEAADHNAWTNEGIVFHIYPRSFGNESAVASGGEAIPTIPGTLPLYLYRENAHDFYFFVTHRLAIAGVTFSNVMGYVYPDVGASVLLRGQSVTPLEDPRSFVQQQYRDFLGREPDQGGWNFWTSHILGCGNDAACVHLNRVQVSQAYYQSDEFQDSGYFVCRLYQASYNRRPNFNEFMPDRSTVVGGPNLEASKVAFVENWLARPAFQQTYPESLTAGQFVDNLNANTGNSLSPAERNALVQGLLNQTETRATALRKIADNATFRAREYNKAFVVMQYFAYLRRNPDQGGLDFWLDVINHRDPNNYFGMVCAFVTSAEYQLRFGPAVTRTDQDCMTTAVGAPPPQVTITSPETGVVFNGPAEINFDASASNADGSIVKVEFLQGGIKIGEDNTTPYSLTWANVQPGNYQVTAKATDTVGSVVMSPPVTVIVNSAPAVTITSPVNGQTFPATSTLPLSANASDPDGTVTKVEFYAGATLISADTAAPYTFSWSAVPSGVYSLTAKATDNLGATTISGAVNVTVNVVNSPPSVGISLPANNAIFTAPANLTITATAGDPDGTISQVQFYSGTTLIGTANSTPFTITWNNVSAGSYTLTARATDNLGAATTSSAVNIVVNSAPTISIISPTNNSAFTPPATIAINVAVADSDGSVTKVEFFDGPTKVGETLSSPFNFNWAVVPAGSHNLTAQASDNLGATTASSVVAFNVLPPPGGRITFTTNRDGNDEIYSMNLDGSNPVRLTNNAAIDSYSRWSPDGSKIVFASERDGNSEIYVMNADGANQTRLTNNISFDGYASWSPDGGKIAFAGDRDGNRELYVMNPDGTGQTRLTNNGATDSLPMWSPDGTRLAFHSNRDGGMMEVYVMNADGSGQTRLTNNPATDFTPAWSTNGSKIFFVSDRDGNYEVYSMNPDGSGQANLTNNSAWDASSATSSPDGTKVIFISNRDGNDEVYQMNTDGSNQNRLTDNSARERYPAWQPGGIRTNVALASNGGIASASSTYNSGYAANGANNSDRKGQNWANGGGWNDATPATHPDWLQIDFAGNKVIDEVDVFTVQDSYSSPSEPTLAMTFSTYGLTGYEVQYWDGVTWITLPGAGVTSNNKVWRKFSFPAVNTARIRILTNAALADYSRITEVEAYGVAAGSMTPPSNVALSANGGTAVASSYFSNPSYGTYLPSSVNDGSRRALNNAIWLDNTNGVFPDWIEVDFNGGKTINEIDVITQQDDSQNPLEPTLTQTFSTWGIVAFEVQYWNGLNWITVPGGSVSGNNKVWRQFTFANITASKIRVLVNDAVDHIYSRVVEVEAWSPATTGQTATYQASTNFATTQGQQNWYYLDSTGAQMSFNASGGYWEGPQSYLWLWSNGGHPGPAADAVRQWRAPQSGSIHITGNVADANTTCGDGVVVSIRKGATVLWQQSIENGNTAGFSYDLITSVAAGDQINFVINRRVESNYCDGTNFDPAITLTW